MKITFTLLLLLMCGVAAIGQNEQAPILEKDISYKNWKYKSVRTGEETDLRSLAKGKKLVIVVYFAPWCGNWKHDAPFLQKFYEKYQSKGLEIVGVGEYDPVSTMKANLDALKITFPVVYESENRSDKQKTLHYGYRKSTGDNRNWGSPWYIFLQPSAMAKKGDVLVNKTFIINGEMIEAEGEKFIREKLGLPAVDPKATVSKKGEIVVCAPEPKPVALVDPDPKKP